VGTDAVTSRTCRRTTEEAADRRSRATTYKSCLLSRRAHHFQHHIYNAQLR
jgi:hypothetical protein